MATQNSIALPDLTDVDKAIIFQILDAELNSVILYSLLIGIYTGIVAVTLRNIYMNKSQPIGRVMVLIVVLLHAMTIFNFASCWAYIDSMFIDNGWNFWTIHLSYSSPSVIVEVGMGATGAVCTILADSTMIWRCWMVWGRRWLAILLPTFVLIAAIVFKIIGTYELYNNTVNNYALAFTLYSSLVLAMTLWCTLLIIYRIVSVARAGRETGASGVRAYRNIIEVLVESSALYSAFLILYVVFNARDPFVLAYFDVLAGIARGIAPTLLVGRVAAGHSRPDDSWRGSVISGSIRFGTHSGGQLSLYSATTDDLEAQRQRDGEYDHHIPAESQGDMGNDSIVHEDDYRSQREGDDEYGHFMFKGPQDGPICIDLQSVIQGRVPS